MSAAAEKENLGTVRPAARDRKLHAFSYSYNAAQRADLSDATNGSLSCKITTGDFRCWPIVLQNVFGPRSEENFSISRPIMEF